MEEPYRRALHAGGLVAEQLLRDSSLWLLANRQYPAGDDYAA